MGKTIIISNEKGGCGKTTTSINLSANLANAGKHVLLIDIDPQGNLSNTYDAKDNLDSSIYRFITDQIFEPKHISENQDLISSGEKTKELISKFNNEVGKELYLKDVLDAYKNSYDYIIIDCPSNLNYLTDLAYTSGDILIIPVSVDRYSIEGMAGLSKRVSVIKRLYNPDLQYGGILMTNVKLHTNAHKKVKELANEVLKYIHTFVFDTVIRNSTVVSDASLSFKPLIEYNKKASVTQDYLDFTKELMECDLNE